MLNFSVNAARLGHNVSFVSAVGDDDRGGRALREVQALGLDTRFIRTIAGRETGTVSVEVDAAGQPSYTIHRPAAYDFAYLEPGDVTRLAAMQPDWIGYGTLHAMHPAARDLLRSVAKACPRARKFYDINLRRNSYSPELIDEWSKLADVVKLNEEEMLRLEVLYECEHGSREAFCRSFAGRFGWTAVCITRAENGCALWLDGEYVEAQGQPAHVADAVGAGDAFAAGLLHGIQAGWRPNAIATFANRLGALVAGREGALPLWSAADLTG